MKQHQSGFTLIELVVVIVILGILAATAMPKFVDLSEDADRAAVQATAASLSSAAAINFAACALNPVSGNTKCKDLKTCTGSADSLVQLVDPDPTAKYDIAVSGQVTATNGTPFVCKVTSKRNGTVAENATGVYFAKP